MSLRDERMARRLVGPRPLTSALDALTESLAPSDPISRVQRVWRDAVGEQIAANCEPESERSGVVKVRCTSAVWAQELDLLAPDLIERINAEIGAPVVSGLRCSAAGARRYPDRR